MFVLLKKGLYIVYRKQINYEDRYDNKYSVSSFTKEEKSFCIIEKESNPKYKYYILKGLGENNRIFKISEESFGAYNLSLYNLKKETFRFFSLTRCPFTQVNGETSFEWTFRYTSKNFFTFFPPSINLPIKELEKEWKWYHQVKRGAYYKEINILDPSLYEKGEIDF